MKKEHFEILLEDMKGDIKQVLEGPHVLHNEIVRTREELREEIKLNTIRIEALSNRVDSVEKNLGNRIDAVDEKLTAHIDAVDEKLSNRIDAVAADLKAHRADTESHHGVYRVQELQKE